MSASTVTALVLVAGDTAESVRRATMRAVRQQDHAPDRVILVVPDGFDPQVEQDLRTQGGLEDQDIVRTHSSHSRAGALRDALARVLEDGGDQEKRPSDGGPDATAEDAGGSDEAQASPAAEQGDETPRPRRGGRRAREIDRESREAQLAHEAEDIARIPMRLREERRARGRRIDVEAVAAGEDWLWIVPDDSVPGAAALREQIDTLTRSPRTAVVGAKRLLLDDLADSDAPDASADHAAALVDVGMSLTHGGRIATGIDPGEIDQGQADWREDVLAVGLAGMLIRTETLRSLGGLDPDLPSPYAEIDLCQRVWRSGERVAVNPAARVLAPVESVAPAARVREQRRGQILGQLKLRNPLQASLLLAWLPLLTLWRAVTALLLPEPARALAEVRGWVDAMRRRGPVMARGRRARAEARVPQARLAPLYLPRGEDLRQRAEAVWTNLFADDERTRRQRLTTWGIAGTRHGIDDPKYGRHLVWFSVLALSAVALTLLGLRRLFAQGDLVGPSLVPLSSSWLTTLQVAWASWVPEGLGWRGPGDPLLRLLSVVPLDGDTLVGAIVMTAIPLSAMTAWWAAGALTRAIGARLVAAVVWALAPSLLAALQLGAWPILLAHVLLPLLALVLARAVGLPGKVDRASVPAAAAGGLLLLVIGAVQPVIVPLMAVIVLVVMCWVPGRRLRLLWFVVPSLALHAPFLPLYAGHPELLLAVGAVSDPGPPPGEMDLMALWPIAASVRETLVPVLGTWGAQAVLMLPVLVLLIGALTGPFLRGRIGVVARVALVAAGLSALPVAWTRSLSVELVGDEVRAESLHLPLDMVLLALAAAALCAFDAFAVRREGIGHARRGGTSLLAVLVASAMAATVGLWALVLPDQLKIERGQRTVVPAAASDYGRGDVRGRVLVLESDGVGGARASVLTQGADTAATRAAIVDLRRIQAVQESGSLDDDPGSAALRDVSAQLLSRGAAPTAASVRALAIGYVVVPGDPAEQTTLIDALDTSPVLEKVTQTGNVGLWRVSDAAPRAWVGDGEQIQMLPSGAVDARGTIEASEQPRNLVLSERFDSRWRATVGGTELTAMTIDGWAQGWTIPAGAEGEVVIDRAGDRALLWQALLGVTSVVTLLVALPWRRRGKESDVDER